MMYSVIIPNLNSGVIHRTLEALEQQAATSVEAEVIVVGVDSPRLVRPSRLVRFIDTGSAVTASVARNIGIERASGEVLCFLDADCVPRPGWLAGLVASFRDPAVSVLGGGVDSCLPGYWERCEHVGYFHEYLVTAPPGTRSQLPSLNLAVRRSALEGVGVFDVNNPYTEDSDLTTRLRLAGHTLWFDPLLAVEHWPDRANARAVLCHSFRHGSCSIKVNRRWWPVLHPPFVLRHAALLLAAAPFLSLVVTARIFTADASLARDLQTVPGVFLMKLAWCMGAAHTLAMGSSTSR